MPISVMIKNRRWTCIEHVNRMDTTFIPKKAMRWTHWENEIKTNQSKHDEEQ